MIAWEPLNFSMVVYLPGVPDRTTLCVCTSMEDDGTTWVPLPDTASEPAPGEGAFSRCVRLKIAMSSDAPFRPPLDAGRSPEDRGA